MMNECIARTKEHFPYAKKLYQSEMSIKPSLPA